jgi:hypothetical protein
MFALPAINFTLKHQNPELKDLNNSNNNNNATEVLICFVF